MLHTITHEELQKRDSGWNCRLCGTHFISSEDYDAHVIQPAHLESTRRQKKLRNDVVSFFFFFYLFLLG